MFQGSPRSRDRSARGIVSRREENRKLKRIYIEADLAENELAAAPHRKRLRVGSIPADKISGPRFACLLLAGASAWASV